MTRIDAMLMIVTKSMFMTSLLKDGIFVKVYIRLRIFQALFKKNSGRHAPVALPVLLSQQKTADRNPASVSGQLCGYTRDVQYFNLPARGVTEEKDQLAPRALAALFTSRDLTQRIEIGRAHV